jgi:hypothetical protein
LEYSNFDGAWESNKGVTTSYWCPFTNNKWKIIQAILVQLLNQMSRTRQQYVPLITKTSPLEFLTMSTFTKETKNIDRSKKAKRSNFQEQPSQLGRKRWNRCPPFIMSPDMSKTVVVDEILNEAVNRANDPNTT